MVTNHGQVRRTHFRALVGSAFASYQSAVKLNTAKGAKDDKRLDLMWPAQRGMSRSHGPWLVRSARRDETKGVLWLTSAMLGDSETAHWRPGR